MDEPTSDDDRCMTVDELRAALDDVRCSGETPVWATLGDAPTVVVAVDLTPHERTGTTPPRSVTLHLRPLRP